MYCGTDLKPGKKFIMAGEPYQVLTYAQKVVGRGGSIINIKVRNLLTGGTIPKTLSDKDMFEPADIYTNSYDYLYNDGEIYYFMNTSTYEQIELQKATLGGDEIFLKDGDKVMLQEFNQKPINVQLDASVTLEVIDTPPGERGDTATGGKKPATMSTGLVVQVPLFINIGDNLRIDTRTRGYLSRA